MTDRATNPADSSASWSLEEIRRALVDKHAPANLVDQVLAQLLLSKISPRDRRDQMILAVAVDFYSTASTMSEVVDALSRDLAFSSTPRWGATFTQERRLEYRRRVIEIVELCDETGIRVPGAGLLRNILAGSRTPGKRLKTSRFQPSNFSMKKLKSPPDLVGS